MSSLTVTPPSTTTSVTRNCAADCTIKPRPLVAAISSAATSGLGFMVQSAAQFLVTDVVVLGILVIALIAFAMEMGLRALQRKLVPWHGQAH